MQKKEGVVIIKNLCSKYPYAVDFRGYNEGSGSPCLNEEEVNQEASYILTKFSKDYKIKIIDERCAEKQMTLC